MTMARNTIVLVHALRSLRLSNEVATSRTSADGVFSSYRVPGKVVAQLMGHANVDTTLNVYTQVLDGSVRAAAEKIGNELFTIVHAKQDGGALTD
jgi:integrase